MASTITAALAASRDQLRAAIVVSDEGQRAVESAAVLGYVLGRLREHDVALPVTLTPASPAEVLAELDALTLPTRILPIAGLAALVALIRACGKPML